MSPLADNYEDWTSREIAFRRRTRLYDPPDAEGFTPLDGGGQPMQSVVFERDVEAKLALGFTREPVLRPGVTVGPQGDYATVQAAVDDYSPGRRKRNLATGVARARASKRGIVGT